MDLNTLEVRLQEVARRYVKTTHIVNPQQQQHQQQGGGHANYPQQQLQQLQEISSNPMPMGLSSQVGMGIAPQVKYPGIEQAANGQQSSNGASTSSPSHQVQIGNGQSQPMIPSSALGSSLPINLMPNGVSLMMKREVSAGCFGLISDSDIDIHVSYAHVSDHLLCIAGRSRLW